MISDQIVHTLNHGLDCAVMPKHIPNHATQMVKLIHVLETLESKEQEDIKGTINNPTRQRLFMNSVTDTL